MNWPVFVGSQPEPQHADTVPARVGTAIEFLRFLAQKAAPVVAQGQVSAEVVPGQQLASEEQEACEAACRLLQNYFDGLLKPSQQEEAASKKRGGKNQQLGGTVVTCFACWPNPRPTCMLCEGGGTVIVSPTSKKL